VVPIRLTLDGRSGVTLWATPWLEEGEEWQAFLGTGRRVLLFADATQLADYLQSGEENDLTDHPQWSMVRKLPPAELEPEEGYQFDLDGAYDLATRDPDPFTVTELSDADKPPIIRAYLVKWGWDVGRFFEGLRKDASDQEIAAVAPGFPVFRIN
jgi:hypothetical protein